jgi:hypothetical protein
MLPFHRPIQSVETHVTHQHTEFFYCTLFGGHKCWISRIQLHHQPYTPKDRDVVEMYCITHRLVPISDSISYEEFNEHHLKALEIELEQKQNETSTIQPRKKRWCGCFKQ